LPDAHSCNHEDVKATELAGVKVDAKQMSPPAIVRVRSALFRSRLAASALFLPNGEVAVDVSCRVGCRPAAHGWFRQQAAVFRKGTFCFPSKFPELIMSFCQNWYGEQFTLEFCSYV
jgi:hypothetical protein